MVVPSQGLKVFLVLAVVVIFVFLDDVEDLILLETIVKLLGAGTTFGVPLQLLFDWGSSGLNDHGTFLSLYLYFWQAVDLLGHAIVALHLLTHL